MDPNLYWYLQEILRQTAWQSQKLSLLEKQIGEIRESLSALQAQRSTHIERIEYNFEQLKVETLEGTLVIGLTQSDQGTIDEMTVEGKTFEDIAINKKDSPAFQRISDEIGDFIRKDLASEIDSRAEQYKMPVDSDLREAMIEDLQRQVGDRIVVYLNQTEGKQAVDDAKEREICGKVRQDMLSALDQFFINKAKEQSE